MVGVRIRPAIAVPGPSANHPLSSRGPLQRRIRCGPRTVASSVGRARRCASRLRRYYASGPHAEVGLLALNCFPNFLI
jgi:hypothetical protein